MTMQKPLDGEDSTYRRVLFYDNGIKWREVKAKQVNEYKPPTPVLKTSINDHIQAPANLVNQGTSHYTATITLLFYSKQDYSEWLQYIGSQHKYYDEKGTIYIGIVAGEPSVQTVEQESKYIVSVGMYLVRKQEFENRLPYQFVDIADHWARTFIEEMQQRGLIAQYWNDGQGVQYFRPEDKLIRSEAAALIMRTYKYLDRLLRGY